MSPQIAAILFIIGIIGLFILGRDREVRTSRALWIPVIWVSIATSRPVSQWLSAFGFGGLGNSVSSPDQLLEGSPLDRNVLLGLLVIGIIVLLKRGLRLGRLLRANGPLFLFLLYCAVSITWSDYPDVAFKRWIRVLGAIVMTMIIVTDAEPLSAVKRLLARVGFVMVPLSVLFIKYYPAIGRTYDPAGTPDYTGVTTFKNELGMTCLILGTGAVWCFLRELRGRDGTRPTGLLIAQTTLIAMVLWLFWIANSMTSLACFLMATGLMVAANLRIVTRRPWITHALIAAMIFVSFWALFLNTEGDFLHMMGRDPTLTGRTELWSLVLGMTKNPVFGTGFESFWLGDRLKRIWSLYWWHPVEAHNGYLELYLSLGWIGVALFASVLVSGYRNAISAFRREPDGGKLSLAYFVVAVAYNLTEAAFNAMNPVWIGFLLAIIALPTSAIPKGSPSPVDIDTLAESDPQVDDQLSVRSRRARQKIVPALEPWN